MRTTLFLMILLLSVAGCGYKGPLYLPTDKPVAKKRGTAPPAPETVPPASQPSTSSPTP